MGPTIDHFAGCVSDPYQGEVGGILVIVPVGGTLRPATELCARDHVVVRAMGQAASHGGDGRSTTRARASHRRVDLDIRGEVGEKDLTRRGHDHVALVRAIDRSIWWPRYCMKGSTA